MIVTLQPKIKTVYLRITNFSLLLILFEVYNDLKYAEVILTSLCIIFKS